MPNEFQPNELQPDDLQSQVTPPETRFQCRHVHINGHRCQSPSLRGEQFCYFHHQTRKPIPKAELDARAARQARRAAFDLPRLEDRSAIQAAIGEILLRLAANQLDPRRAGLLLYGLQIASINLPPRQPALDPAETVDEVADHPEYGLIALPQDFDTRPGTEKTLAQILREDWNYEDHQEREEEATCPAPFILDDLEATAATPTPASRVPHSSQPHRDEWDPTPRPTSTPQVPHSSQSHRDEWDSTPSPSPLVPIPSSPFPVPPSSARQYPDAVVPPHARRVVPPRSHLDRLASQPRGLA